MEQSLADKLNWKSLSWQDGCTYEGLTADGACESHGVVMWVGRRERYEGQLRGSRPHGYGAYRWRDGTLYRGEWYDGQMQGCGVLIWKDAKGSIQAKAGKFFDDGFVGPVPGCSGEAAHEAALEADVAAGRARLFETPLLRGKEGRPTPAGSDSVPEPEPGGCAAGRGDSSTSSTGAGGWSWPPWAREGSVGGSGGANRGQATAGGVLGKAARPAVGWAAGFVAAAAEGGSARWGSLRQLQERSGSVGVPSGWNPREGGRPAAGEPGGRTGSEQGRVEQYGARAVSSGKFGEGEIGEGLGHKMSLDQRRQLERLLAAGLLKGTGRNGWSGGGVEAGDSSISGLPGGDRAG